MKYYISCQSYPVVYREADPDDEWDYGHNGYEGHSFTVSTKSDGWPDATFETDIVNPFFIAVIYSTGCTFGQTSGMVQYLGPFTEEEADRFYQQLENENGQNYDGLEGDNEYFYPYWIGYFEDYQHAILIEG